MPMYVFILVTFSTGSISLLILGLKQRIEDGRWTWKIWLSLVPLAFMSLYGTVLVLDRDPGLQAALHDQMIVYMDWPLVILFLGVLTLSVSVLVRRIQQVQRRRQSVRHGE